MFLNFKCQKKNKKTEHVLHWVKLFSRMEKEHDNLLYAILNYYITVSTHIVLTKFSKNVQKVNVNDLFKSVDL